MIKVKISEMVEILTKISKSLEDVDIDEIEIDFDYYWELSPEFSHNLNLDIPADLTEENFIVGQISEDIEFLRNVIKGENLPVLYSLVWLGNILKAVGGSMRAGSRAGSEQID